MALHGVEIGGNQLFDASSIDNPWGNVPGSDQVPQPLDGERLDLVVARYDHAFALVAASPFVHFSCASYASVSMMFARYAGCQPASVFGR